MQAVHPEVLAPLMGLPYPAEAILFIDVNPLLKAKADQQPQSGTPLLPAQRHRCIKNRLSQPGSLKFRRNRQS